MRAWLAFSALGSLGFAAFLYMDGDHPLQSDDPYIAGFTFGGIAAGLAIVYTVAETIAKRVGRMQIRDVGYAAPLAAWILLLWAGSCAGGEGAEIGAYAAVASLIIGVLTYPLCRFRMPQALTVIVACLGVVLVAMYCVVYHRMAARRFPAKRRVQTAACKLFADEGRSGGVCGPEATRGAAE